MNIYKISQEINKDYDSYNSAIVYANNEQEARYIHPDGKHLIEYIKEFSDPYVLIEPKNSIPHYVSFLNSEEYANWVKPEEVIVEYIGKNEEYTGQPKVILSSFNQG